MTLLASILANPWTIGLIASVLLVWAAWSTYSLHRGTTALCQSLETARRRVISARKEDFAARYDELRPSLERDRLLGMAWRDYAETLIIPERSNIPIRSTFRPSTWFNLDLCRNAGLDLRYHAALPSLLVGGGLLFTFFGLAVALHSAGGIVGGVDASQRNGALKQLLDAAGLKFWTSVAGLFLSIAYALFRKWRLRTAEAAIDAFCAALEERMPLISPARVQADSNKVLERVAHSLESFTNDLAAQMSGALDKALNHRLGDHIGPLREAIERMAARADSDQTAVIQRILEEFTRKLEGGSGAHLAQVAERLAELGNGLAGVQIGLQSAAGRMVSAADEMSRKMGEGAGKAQEHLVRLKEATDSLEATSRKVAEALASGGDQAAGRLTTAVESIRAELQAAVRALHEQLTEAGRTVGAETAAGATAAKATMAEAGDVLVKAARDAAGDLRAAGQGFRDGAEAIRAGSVELGAAGERTGRELAELQKATKSVIGPLGSAAQELGRAAQSARDAATPLAEVGAAISGGARQVAGVAERLQSTLQQVEGLGRAMGGASDRFEKLDNSLAKTLTDLAAGLRSFTERVREVVEKTDGNLAKAATSLAGAVSSLEETLEDFGLRRDQPGQRR